MSDNAIQPWRYATAAAQVTTDTFTVVGFDQGSTRPSQVLTRLPLFAAGPVSIWIKNTGANTIKYEIFAYPDAVVVAADAVTIQASATIAAGATISKTIDFMHWLYLEVLVAANAGGSQGAADCRVSQKRA